MADVIATIWDFDKTLISGYMQEPMFKEYGIESSDFWKECNDLIRSYKKKGLEVNADTFYLNLMLRYVRNDKFKELSNDKLKGYGKQQKFYPGAEDLIKTIKRLSEEKEYQDFDITFENYVVSTGLKKVIEGTSISSYVEKIWGCEFLEESGEIREVAYSIDNTTKTRAIFEINKGVEIGPNKGARIDVNTKIPLDERRVKFVNMIYVADGPSDVPAFSVINQKGGATFAVYPPKDEKALRQVDDMRRDGRVQMYAEADYTEGSTAYMWIMNQLRRQASSIIEAKKQALNKYGPGTPQHLL
nr:MAG TPA: hypothetical protein [Bacteriophage sp.]